jgi:hypothetical protein
MSSLSESAPKALPDIIRAASTSPLGIFALMIVAISVLAWIFFKDVGERLRAAVFIMLFVGVAAYGFAIANSFRGDTPITGIVLDERSGKPVAGALVSSASGGNNNGSAYSGPSGDFFLPSRSRGSTTLRVTATGYKPGAETVTAPARLTIRLVPLTAQVVLAGFVVDAGDNHALAKAEVMLVETGASTQTDSTGRFRFELTNPARVTLRVSKLGYKSIEWTDIKAPNLSLNIALARGHESRE